MICWPIPCKFEPVSTGNLYLIPNFIYDGNKDDLPQNQLHLIYQMNEFIVESEKAARAFLKRIEHPLSQSDFEFHVLNEHSSKKDDLTPFFKNCLKGKNIGLLSDAGIPCVADPGHAAVSFAHKNKINVKPLSGASSIYMALMASGFNGQNFAFHGYLVVENIERLKKIKVLEKQVLSTGQTQIFMETPYRNLKLFELLLKSLNPVSKLCVATNIMADDEQIISKPINQWKISDVDINKKPTLFILGV